MDYNVNDNKWNLVTGDKEQIYNLARKSYLAAEDVEFKKYDLIHTENFVLIDKESQIRGFYDGTKIDDINLLLDDLEILKTHINEKNCTLFIDFEFNLYIFPRANYWGRISETRYCIYFEGAVKDHVVPNGMHLKESQTNIHIEARVNWDTKIFPMVHLPEDLLHIYTLLQRLQMKNRNEYFY